MTTSRAASADRRLDLGIYAALLLAVLAIYSPVAHFDFVRLDDPEYTGNPHVLGGLSIRGLIWAFTTGDAANWFPLTWISHMLDRQLFGAAAGWHHLTNVAIHAGSTLLLFPWLKKTTGDRWCSAFVAFIFALHPLHIESVAWVAERKDVLSGLFWMLTLWAYVYYVERPGAKRYLMVALMFSLGLMSKAMVVTLPFVLLLLDLWPLRRLNPPQSQAGLVAEKLPLFGLAAISSIITYLVQQSGGAMLTLTNIPLSYRIENSLISYVQYLISFVWPSGLTVFYPYSIDFAAWRWLGSAVILAGLTVLAVLNVRRRSYFTVGWLWYLGTLVPVIGLVQVGLQPRADRYTYLPMIGISIVVAWGLKELPVPKAASVSLAAALCLGWTAVTVHDLQYWRNSVSLFERALDVTTDNYLAQNALGAALLDLGKTDEAIPHFLETLRLRPNAVAARVDLASILSRRNQLAAAEAQYRAALQMDPENPAAQLGLGAILADQGQYPEAIGLLTKAVRMKPEDADGHYNLGRAYALQGQIDQAILEFNQAVKLQPENAQTHFNLANALVQKDRMNDAIGEYQTAVKLRPDYLNARFNLGSALASADRFEEAAAQFREVVRLNPGFPGARESLENCERLLRRPN